MKHIQISLFTIFFLTPFAFTMEHPAEKATEELQAQNLEKQKLEEKLKDNELRQEQLRKQYDSATSTRRTSLSESLTKLENEHTDTQKTINKIDARIVVLDKETSGSTISIQPFIEEPMQLTASVKDWEAHWKELTKQAGRFLGKSGYLYNSNVSVPERIAEIKKVLASMPSEVSSSFNNSQDSLIMLGNISNTLEDLSAKELLNSGVDYDSLVTDVQTKAADLIATANFENTPQSNDPFSATGLQSQQLLGLVDVYDRISQLRLAQQGFKNLVQDLLFERMKSEITNASTDQLNEIKKIVKNINVHFGNSDYDDLQTKLNAFVDHQKIMEFKQNASSAGKGFDIIQASKELHDAVSPENKNLAEIALADQFKKDSSGVINNISNDRPLLIQLDAVIKEYQQLKTLSNDQIYLEKIKSIVTEALKHLVHDKSMPSSLDERMNQLTKIADAVSKSLVKDPALSNFIKVVTHQATGIIMDELQNHTLLWEAAKTVKNKSSAISDAYYKELTLLKSYLLLEDSYKTNDPQLTEAKLALAKRVQRLTDFVNGQTEAQKSGVIKFVNWLASPATSALISVASLFKGTDALTDYLKKEVPGFVDRENAQKTLFARNQLEALPEDLLIIYKKAIETNQEKLAQTRNPEELKNLVTTIINLDKDLNRPLFTDGDTKYPIQSLLIDENDIISLKQLSSSLAPMLINVFTKQTDEISPNGEAVGDEPDRKAKLDQLEYMRDRLLQDPSFNSLAGTDALIKKINNILDASESGDKTLQDALIKQTQDILDTIQGAGLDDIINQSAQLDDLIMRLESFINNSLLRGTALKNALTAYQDAQGWSSVMKIAENYKGLLNNASAEATQKTYAVLTQELPSIIAAFDYRQEEVFTDRLQPMAKQERALEKVVSLLSEQKITKADKSYNLVDLGLAIDDMKQLNSVPQDVLDALVDQQWIEKVDGGYVTTLKGDSLADIVRENLGVFKRQNQLKTFIQKNGTTPPPFAMKWGKIEIKLAEELKLSWMIPDDQTQALKLKYLESLKGAMQDHIVNLQNALTKRFDSMEEALQNVAIILKIKPEQAIDPTILAAKAGFSAQAATDPAALATAAGIKNRESSSELAIKLGISSDAIRKAQSNRNEFTKMIEKLGLPKILNFH